MKGQLMGTVEKADIGKHESAGQPARLEQNYAKSVASDGEPEA